VTTTTTTGEVPRPRHPHDVLGPVPTTVAGRFQVVRVLHRGVMSATLTATDQHTGGTVVLKTARAGSLPRGTRLRLLHEADVLRTLNGSGLVPLVAAGEADGLFYLAMPLVDGRTLAQRLTEGRLSVTETLSVGMRLLTALTTVHGHGVLHRDIKPSNVMVDGAGPVHNATLIDFGLARSASLDESLRDEPVGTARYMSPEQAGLVHREVDERSDLYSVGVLLFECLAGQPPFTGATVGEVLRQHLAAPVPDVRTFAAPVPTALNQFVQRLLRKDPRDRYQSAAGALADLQTLSRMLRDGDRDPTLLLGAADRRATLTEPAFVGRRDELAELLGASREAMIGRGGVILVEAESGGGKSRLLEELAARALDNDTLVLRGQGVDEAARRPFEVLEGVARGLREAAGQDRALADRLRTRLADDRAVLCAVLPVMSDFVGAATGEELLGPEEHGEARALAALGRLLDVLGSQQRPALLLLDDCQWADEPTIRLLGRWQRELEADTHVLVVAAFRAEEVAADNPLRAVTPRCVTLAPFAPGDMHGLVESMAGPVPEAALDLVTRLAGGSPFMASAVLRGLVESGALFHDGQGWRIDPELMADVQSSREAATFLTRRLELLDADAVQLLAAGAVLGKEFDVEMAAGLTGAQTGAALATLQALRGRHLLWLDVDALRASFVHDKLREALLDRLSPVQRKTLHAAAAELLAISGGSAYDLAYHFHAAGNDRDAFPFAIAAAEQARSRHALAAAEQQYRIALVGVDPNDVESLLDVCIGLGDVLMLRGLYDDATASFRSALDVATDAERRADIAYRLGELAFKRGAVPEAVEQQQNALRILGRMVPRSRAAFLVCALWEVLVQTAHCLLPRRWIRRRRLEDMGDDLIAARIYSKLAYSYWFSRGAIPCGWAHLREMNLLERYPPTLELAQAYSEHAPVASTLPWYSRGIAYAQKSLEISREFGDVWRQGQSLHFYGVVLYAASRFETAIEKLLEAIRLLDRTGDQWEISTALWHLGFCYYRLGRVSESMAMFRRCLDNGRMTGNLQATAIAVSGMAKVSGGMVDPDEVADLLDRCSGDLHTTGELAAGEAVRLIATGDAEGAAALLTRVRREVRRAGVRNEYVAPLLPWLLSALRQQAESSGPYEVGRRRRLLRRASRVGWRARLVAEGFRNNLPHVLREQALVALLAGRLHAARRLVRRGVRVAGKLGMLEELAELRRVQHLVEHGPSSLAHQGPVESLASVNRSSLDGGVTIALVDRFDTLLRMGRVIATALTPDAIYQAVRAAAIELLHSEACAVVLLGDDGLPGPDARRLDESSGLGLSERLVFEAVRTRSVAIYSEATADPSESIVLQQARSALAAPISVRGRPVACWHAVHRQVSDLFGAEEKRLAEFISALAGAALENAEGFAEVQALSHSLELRVDERTAELSVANTALRSTLAELERVNSELRRLDELKSDFVAMVSHELRSPLTSIIGYCSTMMRHWDSFDTDRKRSFVEIIDTQSRRLSGLVNDLLEMSRIESGHLDTQLRPVVLSDVLGELVRDYADRLPTLTVSGDLQTTVVADGDHLRRVLINLLDNAMKYGAEPVSVEVSEHDSSARVAVRDGGEGVPEEFRSRLFEKFAQASSGSKRKATGTGLGLSIVRGLVDAMAGDVWYEPPVDDRAGGFVVRLPLAG
jgi:two-component system sensor kinase